MVAIFQRNSTFIPRTGTKVSTTTLPLRAYLFTFTMSTGKKITYVAISLRVMKCSSNAHISCETNRNYINTNFNVSYRLAHKSSFWARRASERKLVRAGSYHTRPENQANDFEKVYLSYGLITSAEREVKDSRRSGMHQSCNFLTRLGKQSL